MMRYLLDTNHIGETMKPVSVVRDRIQQGHKQGHQYGVCMPVLFELWAGIAFRADITECNLSAVAESRSCAFSG